MTLNEILQWLVIVVLAFWVGWLTKDREHAWDALLAMVDIMKRLASAGVTLEQRVAKREAEPK